MKEIQCFLDVVSVGKVGSPLTVNWYAKCLNRYVQWAESHSDDPFSRRSFNAFIVHLKQEGRTAATVRAYVVILKRLGRWLLAEEYVDRDPSVDLKYPPKPKRAPRGISRPDFEKLLAVTENSRDRALLLILWESGARADEIMALHWCDVNLDRGYAQVNGKGNRERPIFFKGALEYLRQYRETVPHGPDDPLWWSSTKDTPLTYWGLYLAFRRLGKKAGVKRCNPHSLRHSFGRRFSKKGCPTLAVQDLMGHASPETTRQYTYLDADDLAEIYDQYI